MIVRQYAPCNLGRNTICLGKQGEINALRVEFDVSAWMAMYPDATVKLMHFAPDRPQDNPVIPTLGVEGTTRVWIVGEYDTASAGNGVIELLLLDERTGSTIKSATGYTTVLHSPSAGIEAQEAEAGYVRYDIDQSALLTDEQKAVARKNIGAGTGDGTGGGTGGITVEKDPTVPEWAKQPRKPTYTASEVGARPDTWMPSASEVGADAAGTALAQVGAHNVSGEAHADMRALIEGLTRRLNALADSDDTTLDQLSEIVAYIKSNKALIDAVTTGKVSTSDIVDNLTTNASGKVLSAAQGVRLKSLIDAIVIPDKLPNPQPLTINGQSYDGSAKVEVTLTGEGGGANINDTTPSSTTTYSSQKIESELNALNEAIDAKGDPTDEQVSTAVNAYLTENPVSGLSETASALLITILRGAVYSSDQSANITALENALGNSGSGTPEEPIVTTYTISSELINCTSSNSATSVNENDPYTATLTANDGYTLDGATVSVTMGGADITNTAYADGVITIAAVTGNVEIIASAVAAQAEAVLPEDGLVAYFDLRSLDANTVNAVNTVGTAHGIPTATRGSASLFSWGAWVESSDEIGTTLKRSMFIGAENTAKTFAVGTEYTAIGFTFGGYGNCFGHSTTGNGWSVQAKYVTSGSTSTVPKEMISGGIGNTNKGYLACGYRVSGETIDFFADGEKVKTYVGSDYDNFVRWYDTTDNFSVAPYSNTGKIVAYVLYNRALTDVEIVEVRDFLRTLEVSA